jgi:hypothetical protein
MRLAEACGRLDQPDGSVGAARLRESNWKRSVGWRAARWQPACRMCAFTISADSPDQLSEYLSEHASHGTQENLEDPEARPSDP